jgi:hypothetical protein
MVLHFTTAYYRWSAGGDYAGMAVGADGAFRPFWPDSRSGTFQVWTARVRVVKEGGKAAARLKEPGGLKLRPAGKRVAPVFDPPRYDADRQEGELSLRLHNISREPLYGPIKATIAHAGGWQFPRKEVDFTPALRDLPYLAPGAMTESVRLPFRACGGKEVPVLTLEVTARTPARPENKRERGR